MKTPARIKRIVCLCSLSTMPVVLSADECKIWEWTTAPAAFTVGSTQAQCQKSRAEAEQGLKQQFDFYRERAHQAFLDQLHNPTGTTEDIKRRSETRTKADKAVTDARRALMELPQCTCRARGESDSERISRESREQRDRENAIRNGDEVLRKEQNLLKEKVTQPSRESELAAKGEALASARDARLAELEATREALQEARREQEMQQRQDRAAGPNAIQEEAARRGQILERNAAQERIALERTESRTVLAEMKSDPFGSKTSAISAATKSPTADDPAAWKDPFEGSADKTKERLTSAAAKTFGEAAKKAVERLNRDAGEAALKLPKAKYAAYIRETNDVTSFMKGLERVFKYYDDAVGVAKIAGAQTSDDRSRATWDLGIKLAQDAAKGGATWAVEMLPKRAAAVLLGPVAWVTSITLSSEETAVEPSDVLQRPRDFSSEQRKEVLYRQVRSFANHGDTWNETQRSELLRLTVLVQESSTRR